MIDTELNVRNLMVVKANIEAKINGYGAILEANHIGMSEPLVDAEGYPRSDINVYDVRKARHDIICLQNDLKEVNAKIEKGLHKLHAQRASEQEDTSATAEQRKAMVFARVDSVEKTSPADVAGLREGDKIITFGSVTKKNFAGMSSIANLVQHSNGKSIKLVVLRGLGAAQYELFLVPQKWQGNGMLGCKITPENVS